jgi:hypothetical protein
MAGVYTKTELSGFDPFLVVHPRGYTGTGGVITVEICATTDAAPLLPALTTAIDLWNGLSPMNQNCDGLCLLVEQQTPPGIHNYSVASVLIHELGHCAVGLGHNNWLAESYTNSKDAGSISAGADFIKGSNDDIVLPLPGSRILHWFRIQDNDPVVIDATIIDRDTYTRALSELPVGHRWPASANKAVSLALGQVDTQSVMPSRLSEDTTYLGLVADDVNTVRFAMSGLDEHLGPPDDADDYTVELVYVPDCTGADVKLDFQPMLPPTYDPALLAGCFSQIDQIPIPGQNSNHYRVYDIRGDNFPIDLIVDRTEPWDILLLFSGGFETGDTSEWSSTTP